MPRFKLASNSNQTIVEDSPARARLSSNTSQTVVEDG